MMHTLHVIDQPTDTGEALVLRLSIDAAHADDQGKCRRHAWLLFGGEPTRDAARAAGLHEHQYRLLPKPTGLRRLMPGTMSHAKRITGQAHRVVCWTSGATKIASLLGCAHAVSRCNDANLCASAKGIIERACDGVAASHEYDRLSLRQRWGVTDDTVVVALLGDRPASIDASAAMLAVVFTYEALRAHQPEQADVRLLCHPLTQRRGEATVFGELLKLPGLLMQDAAVATPWAVLQGCDAALAPQPCEAGLSILWANAMGLPVIAPRDPRLPMLGELDRVVRSRSAQPKDLADALTTWVQSREPVHASS